MKNLDCPMILLGGGGYTIENASRCWAYETSLMAGVDVDTKIPVEDAFSNYYAKDNYNLHFEIESKPNMNT